jgi:hypothetical protein
MQDASERGGDLARLERLGEQLADAGGEQRRLVVDEQRDLRQRPGNRKPAALLGPRSNGCRGAAAMRQYIGCIFNRPIEVSLAALPPNSVTAFITSVTRYGGCETRRKPGWSLMIAGAEFAFIKRYAIGDCAQLIEPN